MTSWWDAIVVGGGPAGALAAYHLARGGARVVLLEAREVPRHKTCGGGVVGRALRELPIPMQGLARSSCARAELHVVDTGFSYAVERERPIVAMTMRCDLDAALVGAAREAGARLRTRSAVRRLQLVDGGVELGAGGDLHRARCVVAADGAAGATRRLAGWGQALPRIPALEWEAVARRPPDAAGARTARFFFGLAEGGYAWVFPKGDQLSVGALSTRPGGRGLRAQIAELLRVGGIGELTWLRRHGFVIPTRPRREPVARGPVLLAGDAAGLADPVTWEGISHACTSGRLAAASVLEADFRPDEAGARYEAALERAVLAELRLARRLSRLLYGPAWLRRHAFALFGPELCEAMTGVVLGETGYRELLGSPRSYVRLAAGLGKRLESAAV